MSQVTKVRMLTADQVALLRQPRGDLLVEEPDGVDRWKMVTGPFHSYERTIEVSDEPTESNDAGDDCYEVREKTTFKLAIPLWWPYALLPMRRALGQLDRTPRRRWWWSKEVVRAETANMIGVLGAIGAMAGYMGVAIGQTLTYAARDFGSDDATQARTLAIIRIGVVLSFVFLGIADRIGRRPLTITFASVAVAFTAMGALAPNMFALGATQTISKGLATGLLTLITLASTEQVPASARALSIGFLTMMTGLGASLVVLTIPLADVFDSGWRITYAVPLLFLPLILWLSDKLPETKRYKVADATQSSASINWKRFALIAGAAFTSSLYLSPASQLRNEYLSDDLDFTANKVTLFQILISVPATLAIPLGANIADRYGRRRLASIGLTIGAIASAVSFQTSGSMLWISATIGVAAFAGVFPALRGYQTELFPTRARGRVGGMIDFIGVGGSALGLLAVAELTSRSFELGDAIGAMVFGPLIVALLIVFFFPETAKRELEDFNPGDPSMLASDPSDPEPDDNAQASTPDIDISGSEAISSDPSSPKASSSTAPQATPSSGQQSRRRRISGRGLRQSSTP